MAVPDDRATIAIRGESLLVRQFEVVVTAGPDHGARHTSRSHELSIGSADGNDLKLTDPAVSRHHCALHADERGLVLLDLGSRNGTYVDDVEIVSGYLHSGARLRIGHSTLQVRILDHELEQPIAS